MVYLGNRKWFRFADGMEGERKWRKEKNFYIFGGGGMREKVFYRDLRWFVEIVRNCVFVIKLYGKIFFILKM